MTVQIAGGGVAEVPLGTGRTGLLLHLRDETATRGQGEAPPLPGYSRDSAGAALKVFLADPLPHVDTEQPLLPQVTAAVARLRPWPAAAFAAETALLDLLGRRMGVPVWALLRGDRGVFPTPVPVAALLEGDSAGPLLEAARAARARGIATFKVKVGRKPFLEELAVLFQLRHLIGYGTALRLDANGRFPAEVAGHRLLALAALRPEFVEEPAEPTVWPFLKNSPVTLALDESLHGEGGWARVRPWVRDGIARIVVLKPAALGGALRCLELARDAGRLGASTVVTHTMDGPVAMTAAAHLALALRRRAGACGLDRHSGLTAWGDVPLPWCSAGAVVPSRQPGLGLPNLAPGTG